MIPFKNFPENSRVWVYATPKPLTVEQREYISARLEIFIGDWAAHGKNLEADFEVLHRRFLVIVVNEKNQNATGCSIDACVHEIEAIGKVLHVEFFNRLMVVYRDTDNDLVVSANMDELKEMIAEGDFDEKTPVFDNTITSLNELRTAWEIPASKSWVAKYLAKTTA